MGRAAAAGRQLTAGCTADRSGWEVQMMIPRWWRISLKPTRTLHRTAVREYELHDGNFVLLHMEIFLFYLMFVQLVFFLQYLYLELLI